MMPGTKQTVFISYRRRTSWATARLLFLDLVNAGFDAFMDMENIGSGEFESSILAQISARAHFVLVLEPGSLEGVDRSDDWLRREIAHTLACERNVVPVITSGYSFDSNFVLPPDIARIYRLNALSMPADCA